MTPETKRKIALSRAKAWAMLTPEQREEVERKRLATVRRNAQIRRIKHGLFVPKDGAASFSVDSDFDEGL